MEIMKQYSHCRFDLIPFPGFSLDQLEVFVSCRLVMADGTRQSKGFADLVHVAVDDLAAVMDEIDIRRIADLGIRTGGVYLQHTLVEAPLLVCKLFAQVFSLYLLPCPFLCIGRITIGLFPLVFFPLISSSLIRLRMVTKRDGSKMGLSVNSLRPTKYCI